MLNALIVAIIAASAVWVYLDASKHKIGKIRGSKGMLNMSAGAWGIVTLLLWIVGFPAYLIARRRLIAKAQANPIEVSHRTVKALILAALGGLWFLAASTSFVSTLNTNDSKADTVSSANGVGWIDKITSTTPLSDWKLSESTSGIDGNTLVATRAYVFTSQNAQFDVEIICQPGKKSTLGDLAAGVLGGTLSMNIKSFVGDASDPSEASALISESNFVRQNDYSNPVELNYPLARIRIGDNIYSGPLSAAVLKMGDYSNQANYAGLLPLGESIPMTIELKNGAGTFELGIDRSREVEQVLAACGQDQASLAREKAEQEREQAKSIFLAELEHACSATGSASAYDTDLVKRKIAELSNPPGAAPEIEMDCEKSAPEALATFNDSVDQHYSAYIRLRGSDAQTCSREEFMTSLMGLDGGVNIGAADLAFFLSSQSLDCELEGAGPSRHGIPDESGAAAEATASSGSYSRNSPRQRMQAESDAAGDAAVQAAAAADGD